MYIATLQTTLPSLGQGNLSNNCGTEFQDKVSIKRGGRQLGVRFVQDEKLHFAALHHSSC